MIKRKYLNYGQFSCKFQGSHKSKTVQDYNTTVKRIVERTANGVVNPESLRLSGMTFSDFGLPNNLDFFDRIEMLRDTNKKIETLTDELKKSQEETPQPSHEVTVEE